MPPQVIEPLFHLVERNAVSRRFAILRAEDDCVWLYLCGSRAPFPAHECWVLNLPSAPAAPERAVYEAALSPVPAPTSIVGAGGVREISRDDSWTFVWSQDGEAVAACLAGTVFAFVASDNPLGYSRHLLEPSDYGLPWNAVLYERLFHAAG